MEHLFCVLYRFHIASAWTDEITHFLILLFIFSPVKPSLRCMAQCQGCCIGFTLRVLHRKRVGSAIHQPSTSAILRPRLNLSSYATTESTHQSHERRLLRHRDLRKRQPLGWRRPRGMHTKLMAWESSKSKKCDLK